MRKIISFLLGIAALTTAYWQAFRMPLIGDDLIAFQTAASRANGSFLDAAQQSWGAGMTGGHFNPLGQLIGGLFHFGAHEVSGALSMNPNQIYIAAIFVLTVLSLVVAALLLDRLVTTEAQGRQHEEFFHNFARLSVIFSVSLQFHPWSNDPVTSYPMAGAATALVVLLCLWKSIEITLGLLTTGSVKFYLVALMTSLAIVFYELSVVLIPVNLLLMLYAEKNAGSLHKSSFLKSRRVWALVYVPAFVFLGGRLFVLLTNQQTSYDGTQGALTFDAFKSFASSLASITPFGTWHAFSSNPGLFAFPNGSIAAVFTMLGVLVVLWLLGKNAATSKYSLAPWVSLTALAIVSFGSLALHSFTGKYSKEIHMPGQVYLSYTLALIAACVAVTLWWITRGKKFGAFARVFMYLGALCIFFVQASVNASAIEGSLGSFQANYDLAVVSVDSEADESERCEVFARWATRDWPMYYLDGIKVGIDLNYSRLYSEEFCSTQE